MAASAVLLAAGLIAGCGGAGAAGPGAPVEKLRLMVPAKAGGGWHQTAEAVRNVLQRDNLATGTEVFNVAGANGITGLNQLTGERNDKVLMVMGKVMVASVINSKSAKTLKQTTPLARLTSESMALVVPAKSPYTNLQEFLTGWKQDSKGTVVTGGVVADVDHILAGLIADEVGIDPKMVNFLPNQGGGGESVAKLLSGEAKAGISGVSEYAEQVKAGNLRALAVSGERRSKLLPDVKTLKEQGVPIAYVNWRGIVGTPDLADGSRQELVAMLTRLKDSAGWQQMLRDKDWEDAFLAGPEFDTYIEAESAAAKKVLTEIGLV
ncbi:MULTISPECIES: tripartite tricarboxylate transporter substrate binding protein [unclassified Crossiella]|uniref:Bug family tripartite tricarboxylate transporter substrate binding protein n=1 Tax=unclassified Crossiella TaxID=2620835 RepID=UPI001FFE8BFE|nr:MULTISPECIES: tripartite tricarboxylate transporter substrate-binding protein [unclassified Crossiella]MCK2237929.1 tripartite tricarboxylate transporter substrate binding protein [Crossiella sp. S99.2]